MYILCQDIHQLIAIARTQMNYINFLRLIKPLYKIKDRVIDKSDISKLISDHLNQEQISRINQLISENKLEPYRCSLKDQLPATSKQSSQFSDQIDVDLENDPFDAVIYNAQPAQSPPQTNHHNSQMSCRTVRRVK